jgi:hypothetical protein
LPKFFEDFAVEGQSWWSEVKFRETFQKEWKRRESEGREKINVMHRKVIFMGKR